jgi:hypothetical protein
MTSELLDHTHPSEPPPVVRIARSASSLARELAGPSGDSRVLRRWLRSAVAQLERSATDIVASMGDCPPVERHLAAIAHSLVARLGADGVDRSVAAGLAVDLDCVAQLYGALGESTTVAA